MLHWWATLDLRGRLMFWGLFGLGINATTYLYLGVLMPKMIFVSAVLLIIGWLFVPRDDSDTM